MMIGLYDQDLVNLGFCPPNLDLMKIAGYYKSKRDVVSLTTSLSPHEFSEYYYVQDYDGPRANILGEPNVHFGGQQLIGNSLWLPREIEYAKPDSSIYQRFYNKLPSKFDQHLGDRLTSMSHARISLDGKTIWKDWKRQIDPNPKTIMFHDYNLSQIPGIVDVLYQFAGTNRKSGTTVATKYPIQLYDSNQVQQWSTIRCAEHLCLYQINFILDAVDVNHVSGRTFYYDITASFHDEKSFLVLGLEPLIKSVVFLRRYSNSPLLIYDETKIISPSIRALIDVLIEYLNSPNVQYNSLYDCFLKNYNGNPRILKDLLLKYSEDAYKMIKEN